MSSEARESGMSKHPITKENDEEFTHDMVAAGRLKRRRQCEVRQLLDNRRHQCNAAGSLMFRVIREGS